MSNTESSAITRLINEAQGPVLEPYRSTPAAAPRIARGTIAPHQPIALPCGSTQEETWVQPSTSDAVDLAELDDLVEEADATPLPRVLVEPDLASERRAGGVVQQPAPVRRVSA